MMTFYAILDASGLGDRYTEWCGRANRCPPDLAELIAFEGTHELWKVDAESIASARNHITKVIMGYRFATRGGYAAFPVTLECIWRDNTSAKDVARAEAGVRLHKAAQPHCCHGRPMLGPRCPECMERVQHTSDCAWDGFRSVRK